LERYNHAMNEHFAMLHPSLLLFLQTIELESRNQVQRLENIIYGRVVPNELQ